MPDRANSAGAVRENGLPFFLSPTQAKILRLAAEGMTDLGIALELECSPRTVRAHLQVARSRLGAINTTNAVAIALSKQLITFDTVRRKSLPTSASPPASGAQSVLGGEGGLGEKRGITGQPR